MKIRGPCLQHLAGRKERCTHARPDVQKPEPVRRHRKVRAAKDLVKHKPCPRKTLGKKEGGVSLGKLSLLQVPGTVHLAHQNVRKLGRLPRKPPQGHAGKAQGLVEALEPGEKTVPHHGTERGQGVEGLRLLLQEPNPSLFRIRSVRCCCLLERVHLGRPPTFPCLKEPTFHGCRSIHVHPRPPTITLHPATLRRLGRRRPPDRLPRGPSLHRPRILRRPQPSSTSHLPHPPPLSPPHHRPASILLAISHLDHLSRQHLTLRTRNRI